MKRFLFLLSIVVASAVEYRATVNLTDPQGKMDVYGNVTFVQVGEGDVTVTGIVIGLSPGQHGFHVHEKADIATDCLGATGHYNPFNKTHGGPKDEIRHVGDLGNIEADQKGIAHINIVDSVIRLTGQHTILNRSIVVHSNEDDLGRGGFEDSKTTGHAGKRLACGKITNYEMLHRGSNYGTSTTNLLQERTHNSTSESRTVSDQSSSASLYVSTALVLLSAALHLY